MEANNAGLAAMFRLANLRIDLESALLATSLILLVPSFPAATHDPSAVIARQQAVPKEDSKDWKLVRMGNGWTEDGFPFSQNTYKGAAGQVVYFRITHYGSHERAKKEFWDSISKASSVIEQKEVLDKDGHSTGQRAVFTDKSGQKTLVTIVRVTTVGTDLYDIFSYSMQDAVDFEQSRTRH